MRITKEMIAEDEQRWHARDVVAELSYCSTHMRDRKDITNLDIRFYAYIMRKAGEMLKAQEPRVISWQDAESMRLCWVETRFPHTISPADIMHYFDGSPNITVFKIHQSPMDWPIDEYGIKWRCWDKEPTNEQMEATPWEVADK